MNPTEIPDGLELARTTPEFDEHTVPAALLDAHQVAAGVWGRLMVRAGSVDFVFEDQPGQVYTLGAGETIVIAPQRPHRVVTTGPAKFAVEFHKPS